VLRVVHVVLSLDVGGLERNVVNQVREGRKLGQEVSVLCLTRPGTLAPQAEALGGQVVCLNKKPGVRPGLFLRAARALRALRPHVVHSHQLGTLFYAGPAARAAGVPLLVHTEHGREDYAGRRRTRWLGRFGGRFVDRFYCLTRDMAEAAVANRIVPASRVQVICNGIDVPRFQDRSQRDEVRRGLGVPEGAPLVGTTGRLTEIKRQDVLLRAFAEVRRDMPDAHLLLVGDGPLRGELEALAAQLGIAGVTHFAGYQAEPERCLQAMDAFALSSRSEGMPQAVLEASVAGLPVVASRVGGLPELIDDGVTGLLFPCGDATALAAALRRVLRDPALARGLGEAARAKAEAKYSVRRMASEYHESFLEMLARKRPV
jgi:sugar transferase (PEP-CTERM/EpsH1 system associated)